VTDSRAGFFPRNKPAFEIWGRYPVVMGSPEVKTDVMKTRLAEKTVHRHRDTPPKPSLKSGEGEKLEKSITIDLPAAEIYQFWRRFENLPRFMNHLASVTQMSNGTSHWVAKTSRGRELEWDAELIEDKPNEMISWRSLEGADLDNAGSVWFIPSPGGGTVVKVAMKYSPTGGKLGAAIAKVFGDDAEQQVAEDLVRLKKLLEVGASPGTRGLPDGGIND
jgi:uncharacterized membrane protein